MPSNTNYYFEPEIYKNSNDFKDDENFSINNFYEAEEKVLSDLINILDYFEQQEHSSTRNNTSHHKSESEITALEKADQKALLWLESQINKLEQNYPNQISRENLNSLNVLETMKKEFLKIKEEINKHNRQLIIARKKIIEIYKNQD